jgi:hypothetical protein
VEKLWKSCRKAVEKLWLESFQGLRKWHRKREGWFLVKNVASGDVSLIHRL